MQINIIDVIIKKIGGLNMLTTPLGKIEIYMRYIYYGERSGFRFLFFLLS